MNIKAPVKEPLAILTTPRLILRAAIENDIPVLQQRVFGDPDVKYAGGSNFVYADGSVHFLRSIPGDTATGFTPDSLIFQALGTRANNDNASGLD